MEHLIKNIQLRTTLEKKDIELIKKSFIPEQIKAQSILLAVGKTERHIYFLNTGIVKGYQNIDGKIVVQDLVSKHSFFTSLDSFISEKPSLISYETITDCSVFKITKTDFNFLQKEIKSWSILVNTITNEHLSCKIERVKDFQMLTAKERYLKFIDQYPLLALNVSVDNIASFLGMEPQSLSRIRKQIAF